ncbi:MAG: OmpA family protein [Bacteroidales bacterium]|nr:OmpA family protein [Bacteroidales bacterium]
MKSILSLLAFLFLIEFSIFSQKEKDEYELKIKKKDFKTEQEEGLKEAWKSLKLAEVYFDGGVGTYPLARDHYLFAYQYNSENAILNYRIGVCYLYTDDKFEALKYLRKAFNGTPDLHPDLEYYLGRAYHLVMDFDKATEHYKGFRTKASALGMIDKVVEIDKLLMECISGKEIIENPLRVIIANMGDSINSNADDYFSIFNADGTLMYLTSRRSQGKKDVRNPYDNKYFEDIYYSKLDDKGVWSAARLLEGKINTTSNESLVGMSPEGDKLFIYSGKKHGGDVLIASHHPTKDFWKSPKKMQKNLRSEQAEGSVFLNASQDTLYFISANEELTQGGKDILYTTLDQETGKWKDPVNMGSLINTSYDEEGIFLTPLGNEMYFSSKGHNTMGGFDIFYTYIQEDGTWSDPKNIGYPINTPDNDLFFSIPENGNYAYYSTIRNGGMGAKDIYKITFLGSEKELILDAEDILISGIPDEKKIGFYSLPELIEIDSFYYLTGRIVDSETGAGLFGKIEFIDIDNSVVAATAISSDSGEYKVKFTEGKNYGVEVVVKDYLFYLDVVNMTKATTDEAMVVDFRLDKIKVGTKVVLENIYFETSKATLKSDSYDQLNQVIKLLENNETIRLEISGHTDNTGSLKINTKLSEERAKAVVDYIVSQGISSSRLEWKGYAFTQPIGPNDTEEGREKNRRVEFKVLSK